ncbi:MAG: hypothetical protein M3Y66_01655 [Actinomycetota bacterium]|nr:hypothetical protein [Actinomycetota bacterium]
MSGPPALGQVEQPAAHTPERGALGDLAWILGYFLVAGVVAGVVWWQLVDPPYFVRTSQGGVMDQAELGRRVDADGWFLAIGAVAGVLGGLALTRRRDRLPLLTLLAGSVASLGGGALALWLGQLLGHRNVETQLKAARVGAHVTDSLHVISSMVVAAWLIGFLVGSMVILWGTRARQPHVRGDVARGASTIGQTPTGQHFGG